MDVPIRVTRQRFARLVEEALEELPAPFAEFIEQVPVHIETRPSRRLLREMGLEEDELLMGLYEGANLMDAVEAEGRGTPRANRILIFQEDHELACDTEEDLVREVRTTVLHELGHHFGMDEEDLDRLGYA